MDEAIELTKMSLLAHAYEHRHWVVAWSGGKDSTATMTLILHLITSGQLPPPESLTVMYADTRMELPPLAVGAQAMLTKLRGMSQEYPWISARTVMAAIDKRFFVYMLGRGVPPPNNNTLRWCTRQIKLDPMQRAIAERFHETGEKVLTITGVRMGESAIRDGRISMSCSRNGAECGQGWYQNTLSEARTATLAPLIHWRVCNVWDWLTFYAPGDGWDTSMLAQAYGGDQAQERNARTGCVGCPLAQNDTALDGILKLYPGEWGHLEPLRRLRPIYREMRRAEYRLRKHGETKQNGTLASNPYRMGPLTMEARRRFFDQISGVQDEVNEAARAAGRPEIDILNDEEKDRILWHWENNVWPDRWTGEEPAASEAYTEIHLDGSYQINLFQ